VGRVSQVIEIDVMTWLKIVCLIIYAISVGMLKRVLVNEELQERQVMKERTSYHVDEDQRT
jgi:hypothetical protein